MSYLLLSAVALGPVLILRDAATWYGYGFSAVVAAIAAIAWPRMQRLGQVVVLIVAAMSLWHGIYLVRRVHDIGEKESKFEPALAEAVKGGKRVRLQVVAKNDRWIYIRLTHEIPSYLGVPIGDLVSLAPPGEPGDYQVRADGSLEAVTATSGL